MPTQDFNGTVNDATIASGANTFSITKGTASLDVAAGSTLDVNANLTVNAATTLDEAVSMSSKATETKNTFTPVLNFGGATTGITYSVQLGRYVRIGSILFFSINMTLTSKGSATGAATITGLPVASVAGPTRMFYAQGDNVTAVYQAYLIASSQTLSLYTQATSAAALTDANFAADSVVRISGWYEV